MSKEGAPISGFERTKKFVRAVYEESYGREHEVSEEKLDKSLPYSESNDIFFQAQFKQTEIRPGETIPLTMMSLDKGERPQAGVKAIKRRPNASLLYIFANEKDPNEKYQTLGDIGNLYGVTWEMIRQDNKKNLSDLHSTATDRTHEEFPLTELVTKRPRTLASKMKRSNSSDSHILEIAEDVSKGLPTKALIKKYGSGDVSRARKTLKNWSLTAPDRLKRDFGPVIEEINNPDTSMERLCELILEFDHHGLLSSHSTGDNSTLLSISKLQKEAWGSSNHLRTRRTYNMLHSVGIPVNSVSNYVKRGGKKELRGTYWFTLSRTKQEAIDVLRKADSSFKYRPVNQIGGPRLDSIPNTTDLFGSRKGEWIRVPNVKIKWAEEHVKTFFQDCPVSVVLDRTQKGIVQGYYVKKDDIEAFRSFVSDRNTEFDSK